MKIARAFLEGIRQLIVGAHGAVADLGRPEEIGSVFSGFQKYLYQEASA